MKTLDARRLLVQATLLASTAGSALALGPTDPAPASGNELAESPEPAPEVLPAELTAHAEAGDPWTWRVVPYLWTAGIDGDLTVRNVDVEFDIDFDDIWDNLESAGLVFVEARKEQLSLLGDVVYLGLEVEAETRSGLFDVDTDVNTTILELAGLYRVTPTSPFEVGLGARFSDIESELDAGTLEADTNRHVLDAFAAGRASVQFGERFTLEVYGDVGAGDSDFTWQASAIFGLQFTNWGLGVGYRTLAYDFEEGSTDVDLAFRGPLFGVEFRF